MKHLDRDTIGDAAISAVRSALPADFLRPKQRRWPLVAVSLLIAALFAMVFLFRRPLTATIAATSVGLSHDDDAAPTPAFGG